MIIKNIYSSTNYKQKRLATKTNQNFMSYYEKIVSEDKILLR